MENIKAGTEIIGSRSRAKVVKNKVSPPFRQADFDIMYGSGISRGGSILDLGISTGLIAKTGAFFSYNETRIGHGRDNARAFLEENTEIADELERRIREISMVKPAAPADAAEAEDDEEMEE